MVSKIFYLVDFIIQFLFLKSNIIHNTASFKILSDVAIFIPLNQQHLIYHKIDQIGEKLRDFEIKTIIFPNFHISYHFNTSLKFR